MAILLVVPHRALERQHLHLGDLGRIESAPHGLNQPRRLPVLDTPVLDEVARCLVEDPRTPERVVQLQLGQAEQRVPQAEGIEDVGVEYRPEGYPASLRLGGSSLAIAAGDLLGELGQLPELAPTLDRPALEVGEHVLDQQSPMGSDPVVGKGSFA